MQKTRTDADLSAALSQRRENQAVRQDYRVFYDDESRELVANRFARTIDLFGYRFDG
jgi:hypothetical protein